MNFVYFDYNATSPMDAEVVEAMLPFLKDRFGNPSSGHTAGVEAKKGLTWAREQVALLLGCLPEEVIFTGGASEANNLCIKGAVWAALRTNPARRLHIAASKIDHASVKNSVLFLEQMHGVQVSWLDTDDTGTVVMNESLLKPETFLVSCVAAQNEVGTIQPISQFVEIVKNKNPGALFHMDASQAAGKIPVDVKKLNVDMAVIAGQKFYGPKGVGAAYVRKGVELVSLVHGVGHESGRRAGTENVAGIVGLGKACELARTRMDVTARSVAAVRDYMWEKLKKSFPGVQLNGHPTQRLPNTLNVSIPQIDSSKLLAENGTLFGASNGAACHWGNSEPSAVLLAMGLSRERASSAIRFSFGKMSTPAEVDFVISVLERAISPKA